MSQPATRRFETQGRRTVVSAAGAERFRDLEVPEEFYDEALAVLAAYFEGREALPKKIELHTTDRKK
jgi:hypothetical protein